MKPNKKYTLKKKCVETNRQAHQPSTSFQGSKIEKGICLPALIFITQSLPSGTLSPVIPNYAYLSAQVVPKHSYPNH